MSPEFSRTVRIDTLGPSPRPMSLGADEVERSALAERFDLIAIDSLDADASLSLSGDTATATGTLRAKVTQSCVATNLPVEQVVEIDFRIIFRPQPDRIPPDEEVELSDEDCDVVFYSGGAVDIGEAVAETLSLSLDPYPRSADAEAALQRAGVKDETAAGPFGALAGLRDKLKD